MANLCKLERNIRIYKAYLRGVKIARLAEFENLTPTRIYQIVTATKFQLENGNPDYKERFSHD